MSIAEIRKEMRKFANPAKAKVHAWFFKTGPGEYGEGDKFIGLVVPQIRKLALRFKDADWNILSSLIRSPIHEERLLALLILVLRSKKAVREEKGKIFRFYVKHLKWVNHWDLVDTSAPHLAGDFLWPDGGAILRRWAKSPNLWLRRIAMLSTFNWIRRGSADEALRISKQLLHDREDLTHKAVGWMLREIGNRDVTKEKTFLKKHYRKMPRTMLRYAIEKFPETERKKYLKGLV